VTEKLKKIESDIMNTYLKIKEIEEKLYNELLDKVSNELYRLYAWADFVATIDVLISFALTSEKYNYTKPMFNDKGIIKLVDSRHPTVEWLYREEEFVPNDVYIEPSKNPIIVITGPNMAGKSTFLRQVGIIQVMAQIGCFIPAKEATLPIVDKLFTRIGANDYLSRGESTFLVEMQETAKLLREATKNSLLILDEVGRGTSTYDGLSIAWAIIEYLIQKKYTPKTLFATHYHELTKLEKKGKVVNFNILVEEDKGDIFFLRKVVKGKADKSYGIYVAKISGIPDKIIKRAQLILEKLENGTFFEEELKEKYAPIQLDLVHIREIYKTESPKNEYKEIIEELKSINLNTLTPINALNLVHRLKQLLE
jgi:DNA mismatch repair protein MutS